MSYQITNLNKLNTTDISSGDLLIVTDVTSSGKVETKNITVSDLSDYIITSSNISDEFRTGSFTGNFFGILTGSSNSSFYSISSSLSDVTNCLIYSSNNGTSSYSINSDYSFSTNNSLYSVSSSISNNTDYSISSSYFYNNNILNQDRVDYSNNSAVSITSSISQKTFYVTPNDNNGTVYHSMYSDKSAKAYKVNKLSDSNSAIMEKAYLADSANIANTASFSQTSLYSFKTNNAQRIIGGEVDAWAHCSFKIDENYNIIPLSWNNIGSIKLILQAQDFPGPQILINYDVVAPRNISLAVKSSCSPFTSIPITDFSNIKSVISSSRSLPSNVFVSSWASACSSTTARISIYGYKIEWSGEYCIKRTWFGICTVKERTLYTSEFDESPYLKNTIFSFAAFPVPSYTTDEISGSIVEAPPTTLSTKC